MNSAEPITVTVPQAGKLSGLGRSTLWALIAKGVLLTTKVGRRRLILYASLKSLLGA